MVKNKSDQVTGDQVNDRPPSKDKENTILVRSEISRRILSFFMTNKGIFTAKKISTRLGLRYESVRSALRRLCRQSLTAHTHLGFVMVDERRPLVKNVLNNFGKRISLETFEPVERSLGHSRHSRLLLSSEPSAPAEESRVEVVLKSWHDVVAWDSGWPEQRRVTKIHLDPFIIYQVRNAVGGIPKGAGGWLWYYGKQFKLAVSKHKAIQLFLGDHTWKEELKEFLTAVPNLEDVHLDRIWTKVAERCEHMNIVREFHVVDPGIAELKPHLFREDQSQRWGSTNYIGAELLSKRSDTSNRDWWHDQERRRCLSELRYPVHISSSFRTSISKETGICREEDAKRIRFESCIDTERVRQASGADQERIYKSDRESQGRDSKRDFGITFQKATAGGVC